MQTYMHTDSAESAAFHYRYSILIILWSLQSACHASTMWRDNETQNDSDNKLSYSTADRAHVGGWLRSFDVTELGTNRKPVCDFLVLTIYR